MIVRILAENAHGRKKHAKGSQGVPRRDFRIPLREQRNGLACTSHRRALQIPRRQNGRRLKTGDHKRKRLLEMQFLAGIAKSPMAA